jgi:HD-like signal output (HDOD) protein
MKTLVSEHEIYVKLRELMEDPHSDIEDFCEVVSCNPILASSILKIVNSSFFGLPIQIDNIRSSAALLGIGQLYEIVIGISEMHSLETSSHLTHSPLVSPIVSETRWA